MEIFLSWSGERSKALAEALRDWIPLVIQAAEPWISDEIQKGARWSAEVQARLASCQIGIVCITPENQEKPWLLFEAGALSRVVEENVCTLLLGIDKVDVRPPLAMFNHTEMRQDDFWKLVNTINTRLSEVGKKSVKESHLRESFKTYWPRLSAEIDKLIQQGTPESPPKRAVEDMVVEILEVVRGVSLAVAHLRGVGTLADLVRDPSRTHGVASTAEGRLLSALFGEPRDEREAAESLASAIGRSLKYQLRNPSTGEPTNGTGTIAPRKSDEGE